MEGLNGSKSLGLLARDRLTGFHGLISGYCIYLTGCNQYLLVPTETDNGKYPEGQWFDDTRLIVNTDQDEEMYNWAQKQKAPQDSGACETPPKY